VEVDGQRACHAAAEGLVLDEVERPDIGKRVPDDIPLNDFGKTALTRSTVTCFSKSG
jgi:hypothetical protein